MIPIVASSLVVVLMYYFHIYSLVIVGAHFSEIVSVAPLIPCLAGKLIGDEGKCC